MNTVLDNIFYVPSGKAKNGHIAVQVYRASAAQEAACKGMVFVRIMRERPKPVMVGGIISFYEPTETRNFVHPLGLRELCRAPGGKIAYSKLSGAKTQEIEAALETAPVPEPKLKPVPRACTRTIRMPLAS